MTIQQTTAITTELKLKLDEKRMFSVLHNKEISMSICASGTFGLMELSTEEFDNLIEQMIDFRDTIKGNVKMSPTEFMGPSVEQSKASFQDRINAAQEEE